jgi:hypothetical protein
LPDASKDTTLIDVEPNSGTITHYDEGLEINVYLVRFSLPFTVCDDGI